MFGPGVRTIPSATSAMPTADAKVTNEGSFRSPHLVTLRRDEAKCHKTLMGYGITTEDGVREESPWQPRLAAGTSPASERLAAALAEDITDERLPSGARLPAHRVLASALGIGTGTVTKAYAILGRRGLVKGSPGRGMFVTYRGHDAAGAIDLAWNAPPPLLGNAAVSAALAAVACRADAEGLADYGPPGGRLLHRRAVAAWITATGLDLPPEDLLLCNGAQHAIAASLLAASGGQPAVMFTEEFTFPGALRYAGLAGHVARPVGTEI